MMDVKSNILHSVNDASADNGFLEREESLLFQMRPSMDGQDRGETQILPRVQIRALRLPRRQRIHMHLMRDGMVSEGCGRQMSGLRQGNHRFS